MPRTPGNDDGPSYRDATIIVVAIAAFLGLFYLAGLSFIR
jgi:hypothetical protein